MAIVAQLVAARDGSSRAQLVPAWVESAVPIVLVTDVDTGNISDTLSLVENATSETPTVTLDIRAGVGDWRHFSFALDAAAGKRPFFKMKNLNRYTSTAPTAACQPVWTQDFVTWNRATSFSLVGTTSTGTIEWQFDTPFPSGRVYVLSHPLGRQADATALTESLLADYSGVCSPASTASAAGVIATSPAETDGDGRQVGGHPIYGLRLRFGGATTDGSPKRRLVMVAGVHAAGEAMSWLPFVSAINWMLDGTSAQSVAFRANWDVDLYYNVTPNGLYGGNTRTNFRSTVDPNRIWHAPNAEVAAVQTAILAELSGRLDALFSWHGWSSQSSPFLAYLSPAQLEGMTRTPVMQAMLTAAATTFGVAGTFASSGTNNTDVWWAESNGAKIAIDTEVQSNGSTDPAFYQSIGEGWLVSLQATDEAGWFDEAPAGTLALGTPSVTASSISLPWTYSAADHDGIEYRYRLTAGTWSAWIDAGLVSPIEITGLTSSAEYEIEARAYNPAGTSTPQTVTVTVGAQIDLSGAALATATAAGTLTTSVQLAGAAASLSAASGDITAHITLSGAALAQAAATAALTAGAADLAGDAVALAAALGTLTVQIRLAGDAVAQSLATADLSTESAGLSGAAQASATAMGLLGTAIPLAGQATATAAASGSLGVPILLSGAAAAVSSATGELTLALSLEGHSLATALASGSLTTAIPLSGAAIAQALASGSLAGTALITPTARTWRVRYPVRLLRVRT